MNPLAPNALLPGCHFRTPCRPTPLRRGLTLIELLIAVTLTLIIVGIMVRAFSTASNEISIGRARMDMQNQLRMVTETLRRDLQNATCDPRPRGVADERTGYFEYVEGPEFDQEHTLTNRNSHVGDHDDILALTVRSEDRPFRGRFNGGFVESYLAEIVWWVVHDDTNGNDEVEYDENVRLYRRVLLIRPDLTTAETDFDTFYASNDVSVQRDPNPPGTGLVMNSLEDLANRRNRFAHNSNIFPHEFDQAILDGRTYVGDLEGEDLMLSDCVAFDIRVFDPNAQTFVPDPALVTGNPNLQIGQPIEFGDPAMDPNGLNTVLASYPPATNPLSYPKSGGYVDLGYDPTATTQFDDTVPPFRWYNNPSRSQGAYSFVNFPNTWCSWWAGYEYDGIDQDGDGLIDQGTNGLDDDLINGVDDNDERETPPPYAHSIRSLQISVRMIEKKTNQVLQKTIKESFVPN